MTQILIIRHGNTFNPSEAPRRVGCKTDIPLTQSGVEQARALGAYIKREHIKPDYIVTSQLQRAQQTAQIMVHDAGLSINVQENEIFNEIDHGVDENKTEDEIIKRIGRQALDDWNEFNVVPNGWDVDPRAIQQGWVDFANECLLHRPNKLSCVVSSGGIIKFAPVLFANNADNDKVYPKVKTASMSMIVHDGEKWMCKFWNMRPD